MVQRLLCIVSGMDAGGAETFLMKIYRKLDREKYQMDFAVAINREGFYDQEIYLLGGKIYHITPKSKGVRRNYSDIKNIVRTKSYKYVLRISSHSLSAIELLAAKQGGAEVTVFRSSNTNTTSGKFLSRILHKLCMFLPTLYADIKLAPSKEAAEFMFGKRSVKKGKVYFLNNGLDLELYRFNLEMRTKYRTLYNIGDKILIGHVGRFSQQKNHFFLLSVFQTILKEHPNVMLMLIGTGELEKKIKSEVSRMGINEYVIFTGVCSNISELLSAMDIFLFPSLYEGMPNAVIEAQASGLPCLISDTITREAALSPLVKFMSLHLDESKWSTELLALFDKNLSNDRTIYSKMLEEKYNILDCTRRFEELIFR